MKSKINKIIKAVEKKLLKTINKGNAAENEFLSRVYERLLEAKRLQK